MQRAPALLRGADGRRRCCNWPGPQVQLLGVAKMRAHAKSPGPREMASSTAKTPLAPRRAGMAFGRFAQRPASDSLLHRMRSWGARMLGQPPPPPPPDTTIPPGAPFALPAEALEPPRLVLRPKLLTPLRSLVAAPLVAFVATCLAFLFLWSAMPLPALLAVLFLLAALPVSMPSAYIKAGALAVGAVLPVGMCLLGVICGMLAGVYGFESYISPYYAIAMGGSYDNVLASSPGAAYADAGKIRFAGSSAVRRDLALGYRMAPTYCVAPIMDSGPGQLKTVAFWAIGVDCCDARGGFRCGGAGGPPSVAARGGVRAVPDGLFARSGREFQRAAAQAAVVARLVVDQDPVFVHWVADPAAEQRTKLLGGLGVAALGSALFALVALGAYAANSLQSWGGKAGGTSSSL